MDGKVKEFQIRFDEVQLDDLRERIDRVRLPQALKGEPWRLGTDDVYLRSLLDDWVNSYDWSEREAELNQWTQFTVPIGEQTVHFFHVKWGRKDAIPVLLTHGWPDSFFRYTKLFLLLTDFHLIVPSLPGFAFSTLPPKGFTNNAETAELWHTLMTDVLGYQRYVASGGDMGRGVTCYLAANHPTEVMGIHLTDDGFIREIIATADELLTNDELEYKKRASHWLQYEGAYIHLQSTKPQTLAYALSDSPVALAAWMLEKFHDWSDATLLKRSDILDNITLHWLCNSAATSIRMYYGNSSTLPALPNELTVPRAYALFARDILLPPRTWLERRYPHARITELPCGGHFTAMECPDLFAEDLRSFISSLV